MSSTITPTRQTAKNADDDLPRDDVSVQPRPWLAAWTLCRREWVRFIRQGNRVFGALGQPIVFWVLLSALLNPSFQAGATADAGEHPGISYAQYFFPGTLVMIVLFTAIFATISVIEDRREGFLQSVLVAPVPRWSIVAGKVLGGALIALAHAAVFLLLCFTVDVPLTIVTVPLVLLFLFVVGIALTSLGFAIAWPMQSTQGFHAIMMVFLLPMWLLSGAFAPPGNNWIGWVIRFNPLTYCVALLRRILYLDAPEALREAATSGLPPTWLCVLVTLGFVIAMFVLAWRVAAMRSTGDATP
jgi:ABC-2 type transport system permease protein